MLNLNIDEFIEKMKNKEVSTSPYLDLRNEAAQKKNYGRRISFFKKEKATNYKLLPLKSIAFPFDPFTMEETNEYNESNKFRTQMSAGTMMLAFKKYYNGNAEAKAKFLRRAKVDSWNTENVEVLTKEDIDVFAPFTFPYVFTLPLVHVNNKIVTGNPNGADFKVDIKRDEVGNIKDKWTDKDGNEHVTPTFLKNAMELAGMYTSIALSKYKEWVTTEGANKTDDDKFKQKMMFLSAAPISEDRPRNYLLCYAISMGNQLELDVDAIKKMEPKDFSKNLCLVGLSGNMQTILDDFYKNYKNRNVYADFFELDVIVPDIEDKKERGQKTKYNNAENRLSEYKDPEVLPKLVNGMVEYLNGIKDIDKVFLGSSYVSPYDEDTHNALVRNIAETTDLVKLGLTSGVAERYAGLISDVWGAKAAPFLLELGMGEVKEGAEISAEEKKAVREELKNVLIESDDMEEIDIVEE